MTSELALDVILNKRSQSVTSEEEEESCGVMTPVLLPHHRIRTPWFINLQTDMVHTTEGV